MKKNKQIVLSFLFIVIAFILTFLGFSNLKLMKSSYFTLSRENSSLVEKRNKSKEKLKSLGQDKNSKKSKLEVIDNEIKKFDIINNKDQEIDEINKEISDSLIYFRKNNLNEFYNIENGKLNNYIPLSGNFIENNLSEDDIKSNLIMIQFLLNSYYNYDLNRNISKHNIKAYENLGIIDYIKNGDNYIIKSILLNDTSNVSRLKEEKEKILKEEEKFFSVYENIYGSNENIKNLITDNIAHSSDSKVEVESKFKRLNAISIDILNSSVNYLKDFKIINEAGTQKLNILDKTIMSEKIEKNNKIITYYNRINGEDYTVTEEKE
ncbi:hypothetical protein [Peptoniphilus senegalensis]|uniref:hypothetical protein n=1 Tax=Peptoniphilus senegalensis TaxID=1465757 RepID=UPI0002D7ACB6|nr:hypothetical protein [Peptoniphilus senegalensis]